MSSDPNSSQTPAPSGSESERVPAAPLPAAPLPAAPRPPLTVRRPIVGTQRRHFTSNSDSPPAPPSSVPGSGRSPDSAPPLTPKPAQPIPLVGRDAPLATVPGKQADSGAELANPGEIVSEGTAATTAPTAAPFPVGRGDAGRGDTGRGESPLGATRSGRPDKSKNAAGIPTEQLRVSLPPKPSRRDKLSAELEEELEAALGGATLDSLLGDPTSARSSADELEVDARRRAQVLRVHGDNVFFALGGRHEGVVSLRQFAVPPNPGDAFDVIVKQISAEDGLCELVIPGASIDVSDWSDLREGAVVEAKVTGSNAGGLECEVNRIRGFIPASQIGLYRVENFADQVGQKLLCVVTEANAQRQNLVLSHRAVLERQKEESRKDFYAGLEVGQMREGVVRKIHDFGAFVDLGGADGLIHISQLSWERVKHPSEVVQEGQKVQVRIEKIDSETGKLSLSLRNQQDHPWLGAEQKYPVGTMVRGTVSRLANFGAFVKIGPGVEGLVHVTELAHYRVANISKVVKEGQEVEVKIISVDPEAQRIALSLKAALPVPESKSAAAADEADEAPRALAVPKRSGPLKGGVDRPSDGDKFGLQW